MVLKNVDDTNPDADQHLIKQKPPTKKFNNNN